MNQQTKEKLRDEILDLFGSYMCTERPSKCSCVSDDEHFAKKALVDCCEFFFHKFDELIEEARQEIEGKKATATYQDGNGGYQIDPVMDGFNEGIEAALDIKLFK